MSYISLYRKWRSQNFDEIIGQKPIIQTLKNAIQNERLAHAYLFCGPRGTGKTSTARILAKAVNCKKGPTTTPCGVCDNCKKIRDGHAVDVTEIDAASNRGIDEIRDLREKVRYAPVEGRYKVYIIDEVHMLTPEAFNALLKTLEEPPQFVIFVLATTEPVKVPLTISSRCQRLDFARIPILEIKNHIQKIAKSEKFVIDEKALDIITRSAEGSMRDAVSLLDQLVSFAGEKITSDDVVALLGCADEDLLFAFGDALVKADVRSALELIKRGVDEGRSVAQVTRDLINHFRNLLFMKVKASEVLELTQEYLKKLEKQADKFEVGRVKDIIRALSRAELDMKWHPHARLVLEVVLLGLLEEAQGVVEPRRLSAVDSSKADLVSGDDAPVNDKFVKIKRLWSEILESVKKKSLYGYVSLHEGELLEINQKGKLVIGFRKGYAFHKERLEDRKNKEAVEASIKEVAGEEIGIESAVGDHKVLKKSIPVETVKDFFEGELVN